MILPDLAIIPGIMLITIGFCWLIFELWLYNRLNRNGIPTQARIIERRTVRGRTQYYLITYQYDVPSKTGELKHIIRDQMIDKRKYEQLPPGTEVTVCYLPFHPKTSRLWKPFRGNPVRDIVKTVVIAAIVCLLVILGVLADLSSR
jgi:hypothetical protein